MKHFYSNNDGTENFFIFFKVIKNQSPKYLFELIPTTSQAYMARDKKVFLFLMLNMTVLKILFFPSTVIEWNKLDSNIRNCESLAPFRKRILAFISPFANSTFQCHSPKGLKLITRLQLGLSHLRFHKFKHSF